MANIFLIVTFCITVSLASAQSYEETLKQCIKNFEDGLATFSSTDTKAEVERRYVVLNQCIQGKKFPAFSLSTYEGSRYNSEEHKGKVVLLNFWSTKSKNCEAVIPSLNELYDEYKAKPFVILSFAADNAATLKSFTKHQPVKYLIFDKTRNLVNHQFSQVLGYPTTIILNKKGEVVDYTVGAPTTPEELTRLKNRFKKIIETELAQ